MILYLAAAFESQARMREVRRQLELLGHTVNSTWLDEQGPAPGHLGMDEMTQYAIRDLGEVRVCHLLLLDTFDMNERGGREFEAGFGMGTGVQVLRVGPVRNVFHSLVQGFGSWEEAYAWLREMV